MNEQHILSKTVDAIVAGRKIRFDEARENLRAKRPVAAAAKALLQGSLDPAAEVFRMTGVKMDISRPATHKPILLVASKFGVWASEVTMVAATLAKAKYPLQLATEDGSQPHFLSPSLNPDFHDGAWDASVVSEAERDLALRYLKPGTTENGLFANVLDLSTLARPPQVGKYLKDPSLLEAYRKALAETMAIALQYDALCIAGGSGAIPGLMFDRGLHALILAFHKLGKPIMGQCNGGLAILQTLDPETDKPILYGKAVTTHSTLDEYQSGWGWTQPYTADPARFWKADGSFDLDAYGAQETWVSPGMTGNPLIDSESDFRCAAGPDGVFFSPSGSAYSVVVDGNLITCRTTPDGYPGALCLMAVMDGQPPLNGRLFIQDDTGGFPTPEHHMSGNA